MDLLNDLPINKHHKVTEEETSIMKKYFGGNLDKINSKSWDEIRIIVIATILFMVMRTEYFDNLVAMLPNSDSTIMNYGLKMLIYATFLYICVILSS
jgi:hypothetical protein